MSKHKHISMKLAEAARAIEEALPELNTHGHSCGECGLEKKEDFEESVAHKELTGARDKLRRWSTFFNSTKRG